MREVLAVDIGVGALGMLFLVVVKGVKVGSSNEIKCFMRRRLRVETGSQPSGGKEGKVFLKETGEGRLRGRRKTRRCLVREAKEGRNFKKEWLVLTNALERPDKNNQ